MKQINRKKAINMCRDMVVLTLTVSMTLGGIVIFIYGGNAWKISLVIAGIVIELLGSTCSMLYLEKIKKITGGKEIDG